MIPALPARPSYDQALKHTLFAVPDGLLSLIAPDLTFWADRSAELPAVARVADLVWEVRNAAGKRGLLDIELQLKADPTIPERMAAYGIRFYRRDHLPVRLVVVFLKPIRNVPKPPFVVRWLGARKAVRQIVRQAARKVARACESSCAWP